MIPLLLLSYKGISQKITQDSVVILTQEQAKQVVKDLEERKYLKREVVAYRQQISYLETYKQNIDSLNSQLNSKIKILRKSLESQEELTNLEAKENKHLKDQIDKLKKQRLFGGIGAGLLVILLVI